MNTIFVLTLICIALPFILDHFSRSTPAPTLGFAGPMLMAMADVEPTSSTAPSTDVEDDNPPFDVEAFDLRRVNEALPRLTDAARVITGSVERDLFSTVSDVGHRTYFHGGHYWTGVDSLDAVEVCSDDCLNAWADENMPGAELVTSTPVPTWLNVGDPTDGQGAFDAVAHEFLPHDYDYNVTCATCGRAMVADESFAQYVRESFAQYVETALWSTVATRTDEENEEPEPLDSWADGDDIDESTRADMFADVVTFVAGCWRDLRGIDASQVGHDFWLTREHHGAGFWDRGLGDVGDRLTDAAHSFGGCDLYVGDDGRIYS